MKKEHQYQIDVVWTGNLGTGTTSYDGYSRNHELHIADKPTVLCSADTVFRGDAQRHNPEELFLYSLSSCHMLWFLHLCADAGLVVVSYSDQPLGTLSLEVEPNRFTEATLRPRFSLTDESKAAEALALHHVAHHKCFIANSCNFPITLEPEVVFI